MDRDVTESHDIGSGGGCTYAIAAVDVALWDLAGQELGQPLYRLLVPAATPSQLRLRRSEYQ